jgi:hypothetical protein
MKHLRPDDAQVFPPDQFARLVIVAISSGEHHPGEDEAGHVDALAGDGSTIRVPVSANPYQRAAAALSEYFENDEPGLKSLMWRFSALMALLERKVLQRWVKQDHNQSMRIHPAVLDVASYLRLSSNGRFAQKKFVQAVNAVASQNYSHLQDWAEADE